MFDWLTEGIVNYLVSIFNGLYANIDTLAVVAQQTPSSFNPSLWNIVISFNNIAVLPVAYSLFGCFILSDFVKILQHQNSQGLESMRMVFIVIFKLAIGQMILSNMPYFIDGIFDIASHIIHSNELLVASSPKVNTGSLSDALESADVLTLLGVFVQGLLVQGANWICNVIATLIINLRFIEIYAFIAVAAIPLSTITSSNRELSSMGYNFIKRLSALGLQVVFIMIVFMAYAALVNSDSTTITDENVIGVLWNYIGYSLLLVIALFQTGMWSKSLFQVH